MTRASSTAVGRVLADCDVTDARAIATHAAAVCALLADHFGRLVGELGMRTLFERAVYLAGAAYPCVRTTQKLDTPYELLRSCLETEVPAAALNASKHVVSTFIDLIERFIGEKLVETLLREVWPTAFQTVALKETT